MTLKKSKLLFIDFLLRNNSNSKAIHLKIKEPSTTGRINLIYFIKKEVKKTSGNLNSKT